MHLSSSGRMQNKMIGLKNGTERARSRACTTRSYLGNEQDQYYLHEVDQGRVGGVVNDGHVSLEHGGQLLASGKGHALSRADTVDVHERFRRGRGLVQVGRGTHDFHLCCGSAQSVYVSRCFQLQCHTRVT